jgi:hypothetical protein
VLFNFCVLSGLVLTEPMISFFEGHEDAMFFLGIVSGRLKVGSIRVYCPGNLGAITMDSIHLGDRVAIVGIIGQHEYDEKIKWPPELVLVAQGFELVKRDSPGLGPVDLDKKPES